MSCPHRCRDRQICKHVCCKQEGEEVVDEKITGTICSERAMAAREAGNLREALAWVRRGIDDRADDQCHDLLHSLHNDGLRLSEEERRVLTESDAASDAFFSGYCLHWGRFGFNKDREAAYRCFCVAAEKLHVYAICLKGQCLRHQQGVTRDNAAAMQCYEQAAHLGCASACWYAGNMMRTGIVVAKDMHRAALYFKRGIAMGDIDCVEWHQWLMHKYPQDAAPWSRWRPDADVHSTQLEGIHRSQMTMLLVAKRVESLQPVRLMILRFISTRK